MLRARYVIAIVGPISVAAVQFVISFILLHRLDASAFGTFSFCLLLVQLTNGLSTALFCAPMAGDARDAEIDLTYKTSALVYSVVASLALASWFAGSSGALTATAVGLYALLANLRWFARAHAYVHATPYTAVFSDILFSISLSLLYLGITLQATPSSTLVFFAFAGAAAISLLPFGPRSFFLDAVAMRLHHLGSYGRIWRSYARHALQGVLTTEATSNAHAYMITFFLGSASFAPIAAASLSMRPITLCANSITDIERPRMAREISERVPDRLAGSLVSFRLILAAGWLASVLLVFGIAYVRPGLIFGSYDLGIMLHATSVCLAIALVRNIVRPESVLLQAAGKFRKLADVSVVSGIVSIAAAAGLLWAYGAIASLYGVLLGDAVAAVLTLSYGRNWLAGFRSSGANG